MKRKQFLAAGAGGMVLLWLQGCGGGGDDAGNGNGGLPPVLTSCSATEIVGNHGHTLTVAVADLNSTTPKSYNIEGSAGHNHTVILTVDQLGELKFGRPVSVTSSNTLGHTHLVTVTCV
ncbi:MAG: hypothetical protein KIT35_05225 [Piscinibacter sp.]|uniref:hypothetical protein n=1 Tax=Piscinibacter TaxID=1114981 RepID=UPI000FDDB6E9|nr:MULTISPECIES: hypothetical protein [Piscinibacter]MCW5663212.1 hypothetical protein [Piscinibacter sp.]